MNVTLSMEYILKMLQPLNADNKRWLGERLIKESRENAPCQYTAEEMRKHLLQVEARIQQGDPGISNEEVE